MEEVPDTDTLLSAATSTLIPEIAVLLDLILWRKTDERGRRRPHKFVKQRDLSRLLSKLDVFQAEPQLLDVYLEQWVQQLCQAVLAMLSRQPHAPPPGQSSLQEGFAKVVYALCKVRGEKVIVGLLNNEPRYLNPLVQTLLLIDSDDGVDQAIQACWEERYVLFLWISHLLLAPFDLASISHVDTIIRNDGTIHLPNNLPNIVHILVPECMRYLAASTKEQTAAATLLVRLCLRPDMQRVSLLDAIVSSLLDFLQLAPDSFELYDLIGRLTFLAKLVTSGSHNEIGHLLPHIYDVCWAVHTDIKWAALRASATSRKLIIKILRNITVMAIKADSSDENASEYMESVIGLLLELLADSDTPVRMAASKSLALIAMQLDQIARTEIIEAILGLLSSDVLSIKNVKSFAAVDPLLWHGATLTLAHCLYQRALVPEELEPVLDALLLALVFEQRSSTGGSIGTNVRDAANFGLWAIARRYTTLELQASSSPNDQSGDANSSTIQDVAVDLVSSTCLDPSGNIRRGSSAALQELIGRHPNAVHSGIDLVQVVDYHAVGMRASAFSRANDVASLSDQYAMPMFIALQKWRGLRAVDAQSRDLAATTTAQIGHVGGLSRCRLMLSQLIGTLVDLPNSNIADRHGFVLAIAYLLEKGFVLQTERNSSPNAVNAPEDSITTIALDLLERTDSVLLTKSEAFQSPLQKPDLTAYATLRLIIEICNGLRASLNEAKYTALDCTPLIGLLDLCLRRTERDVLNLVPDAVRALVLLQPKNESIAFDLLSKLQERDNTSVPAGMVLALSSIHSLLHEDDTIRHEIMKALLSRVSMRLDYSQRIDALQGLRLILKHEAADEATVGRDARNIVPAILKGLTDMTITERGDVGSLVRIEALDMTTYIWPSRESLPIETYKEVYAAVFRLSLERLDKVRMAARGSFDLAEHFNLGRAKVDDSEDPDHFKYALNRFWHTDDVVLQDAIVEGYCSSAGLGAETLMQVARVNLSHWLNESEQDAEARLVLFLNSWLRVLNTNLVIDRVTQPLLETMAYLCDFGHLTAAAKKGYDIRWMPLLSNVQKGHYKSSSVPRLLACLDIYRTLATVKTIRHLVLKKLRSMLMHPYPHIRAAAAETFFMACGQDSMKATNWTQPIATLKPIIATLPA